MSRERSRGQPGTIEIGSVEPRGNRMLQVRTTASLANTREAYARVSSQALKSGSSRRVIPSSVRKSVRRRGHGLPLLLFVRRGSAEFELCVQFRNLFAKRCHLLLYSSGSGILI